DGAEKPFLRGNRDALERRDLSHEYLAWLHVRADLHNAALVEVGYRLGREVGGIRRELFSAGIRFAALSAGLGHEFLDVQRGEQPLLDQPLADDDAILEAVTFPGQKRHPQVAPKSQLAVAHGGAVRDHLPL